MRFTNGPAKVLFCLPLFFLVITLLPHSALAQQAASSATRNPLAEILLTKGILTSGEFKMIDEAATQQQADERMVRILLAKGVLSQADYEQIERTAHELKPPAIESAVPAQLQAEAPAQRAAAVAARFQPVRFAATIRSQAPPNATEPGAPSQVERLPPSAVISAIVPIRALPVGGVGRDAIVPAFKSNGVGFTPYGLLKATLMEDSSSPNGDDFPLPGFLSDTGPDGSPEFHLKARSSRVGANFSWYDANPKWSISGKLEMDFEGNFNRSDNRNISTVRSSNPSLRLAWARLDYTANRNTFSALFGQDWSPFGSSTLPNILETTSLGIGYGILYERTPQMRIGYTYKAPKFQIMPEFALTLPAVGLAPSASNISQQLGYGERQGPDSNRPDLEGRVVGQWQLDHAPAVPPVQLIFSAEYGKRTAIVLASAIPAAYQKTFATGATGSSHTDGWDFEWQLPTRYATLTGKFYSGADLRYFLVNQLYCYFNDTAGLANLASLTSEDGSSAVVLGTNAAGHQMVAPERPIRTEGGFAQLGIPLSRILRARASGRNAGWSLYALYGIDQANTRDLNRLGGSSRRFSTMAVGTLNYSLNRWVSFSFEQSLYTTHANPEQPLPLFRGVPSREWNDVREEFGPVFNF
jgi:hypothetical protein